MLNPPPKPKMYSSDQLELILLKEKDLRKDEAISNLQDEVKNLTIITERLSEKVASLSDVILKFGVPAIISFIGGAIMFILKK